MDCEAFEFGRNIKNLNDIDECRILKWKEINERGINEDIQHISYIRCKKGA